MRGRPVLATMVGGGALAAGAAALAGAAVGEAMALVAYAAGGALAAGAAGWALLARLRHRSARAQAAVVALSSVLAVAAGATAAARAMFLSAHDYRALLVVLAAAGTVGLATALVLGDRLAAGASGLAAAVDRLGQGGGPLVLGPVPPATGELAALGARLEEMSARLESARTRERALDASRRELVAWVSHDLRTPLAGLRAMVEALEDGVVADGATVSRYHRTMRVEVDRLAGLVDDLFELSRIQAGALELRPEPASLSDVVSDALAGAAAAADAKGVHLEGRLTGPAPEMALSTPEVLRALRNLLDNAIRHTPPAGRVHLEAGVVDSHAVVSVLDSCGGIPPGELDRVFDLAFRGDAARSREPDGGAGLGLAIARGIVEAHRGDIAVRNENGGCRFTVRLPLSVP